MASVAYPDTVPACSTSQPLACEHRLAPAPSSKFRPAKAREIIAGVLSSRLAGVAYNADKMSVLSREVADKIKQRLKDAGWQRYKYAVQVFIGEQRGEGCRMASRCFWDDETDQYAFESFKNESVFCVAVVFAAYVY